MYGVEYPGQPLVPSREDDNAPCELYYVPGKMTVLMIPVITDCPTDWTRKYYGYLMSERVTNKRTEFVCMDKVMETIPGSQHRADSSHSFHFKLSVMGWLVHIVATLRS